MSDCAPDTAWAAPEIVNAVRRFHRSLPAYRPTPLVPLPALAQRMGLGGIWIKDESRRFGLKAFKALGASYAVCATLAKRLGMMPPLDFKDFIQPNLRARLSACTLVAASDGNHGAAVAWMAAQLGCSCRVFLPRGTTVRRQEAIRHFGAEAMVVAGNYDDAVRQAARDAKGQGGLLVQDTAWEGYTVIPQRVMQGYLTLFDEALTQMAPVVPTHVFVPCGVGALAASLQAYLVEQFERERPLLVVVEAAAADCYYRSMVAGGRRIVPVRGRLETCMAGLACGEPTQPGWEILRRYAGGFASCEDAIAHDGMQRLAFPLKPDPAVESGESGAVTLGCLCRLMQAEEARDWRDQIGLQPTSRTLLFSTEGATDPEAYRLVLGRASGVHPGT
jgi:diaminopropionate ammonia-lyase